MIFAFPALYGIIAFNVFLLLPFMYFFFEEKDDDVSTSAVCLVICYSFNFDAFLQAFPCEDFIFHGLKEQCIIYDIFVNM